MRKIEVIGNVTKDADVRTIPSGKSVINFDVAINERWTDKNGEKKEKTSYVKCAIWRDKTTIAKHITKGTKVWVEGTPEADAYINNEGKAVGNVKINVREIELLGGGKRADGQTGPAPDSDMLAPTPDDDLPF